MNKTRRAKITESVGFLETAKQMLSEVLDEEQDAMDNMPENLQESERYSKMEDACCTLEYAIDDLDLVVDSVMELV